MLWICTGAITIVSISALDGGVTAGVTGSALSATANTTAAAAAAAAAAFVAFAGAADAADAGASADVGNKGVDSGVLPDVSTAVLPGAVAALVTTLADIDIWVATIVLGSITGADTFGAAAAAAAADRSIAASLPVDGFAGNDGPRQDPAGSNCSCTSAPAGFADASAVFAKVAGAAAALAA